MSTPSSLPAHVVEWFTQRKALAHAPVLSEAQQALRRHAYVAMKLADACIDGVAPHATPTGAPLPALALSLYREAAHWALAARDGVVAPSLARAFDTMAPLAGVDVASARVALVDRGYIETAALDEATCGVDAIAAQAFVHALFAELDARPRALQVCAARLSGVVLLALLLVLGRPSWREWLYPDVLRESIWRASSAAPGYAVTGRGFDAPVAGYHFFFHTVDEPSPWIEFELDKARTLSEVTVLNRGDCCADRAVPLVVEGSVDGQTWTELARRTEVFERWHATFSRRNVRRLRLRSPRATVLHLSTIEAR
jgi:hypothetical protein